MLHPVPHFAAGLGYETSLAMTKAGAHVILASRNPQKGKEFVLIIATSALSLCLSYSLQ